MPLPPVQIRQKLPTVLFGDKGNLLLNGSATAQLSSKKLSNQYGVPVEVLAIRFFVVSQDKNTNAIPFTGYDGNYDFGSIVTAKLDVDTEPLTNGYVHLRSMGSRTQPQLNTDFDRQGTQAQYYQHFPQTYYEWKLPPGFILKPQEGVSCILQLDSTKPCDISSEVTSADVWVIIVARLLDPSIISGVSTRKLPYAMEWAAGKMAYNSAGAKFAAAGWAKFRNPFKTALNVERFVAAAFPDNTLVTPSAGDAVVIDALPIFQDALTARIVESNGRAIVPDPTPLGVIVNLNDGDWRIGGNIDPGQWLDVELTAGSSLGTSNVWPYFAVIGSREVSL